MNIKTDLQDVEISFGATLTIKISPQWLEISVTKNSLDLLSLPDDNNASRNMLLNFFYDWHLDSTGKFLVGVSIYFPYHPETPNFENIFSSHPNIVREDTCSMTLFFNKELSKNSICLCNQDFDGVIIDKADYLLVVLPTHFI